LEAIEKEKEEAERKIYGRHWVWEGYFNEKKKDLWLQTAEMLKHINVHVLQDIEDYIMIQGFGVKTDKIKMEIEDDQKQRLLNEKKLRGPDGEDYEEEQVRKSSKRNFMNPLRPTHNNKIWNFFEDCADELKTEHVLRYDANPEKAYEDGRI
jgi:hypothetical protein